MSRQKHQKLYIYIYIYDYSPQLSQSRLLAIIIIILDYNIFDSFSNKFQINNIIKNIDIMLAYTFLVKSIRIYWGVGTIFQQISN